MTHCIQCTEGGMCEYKTVIAAPNCTVVLQMLARKFLHYQHDRTKITGDETDEELSGPPPASLFLLAACMIKVGTDLGCAIGLKYGVVAGSCLPQLSSALADCFMSDATT